MMARAVIAGSIRNDDAAYNPASTLSSVIG